MPKPKLNRFTGHALFGDAYQVKRAQTFGSSSDFSEERLLELGNKGVAEVIDDVTVTCTVEANDYGAIDNFMISMGQGFYSGAVNPNRVFTDADFDNSVVDFTVKIASDDVSLERSTWVGGTFLTGFNVTYTVDGVATESFDFEGEHKRWFLNGFKNIDVYKGDFSSSSQAIISGTNLEGSIPVLITVDQEVVAQNRDNDTITLTDSGADTLVTASTSDGAVSFTSGQRIRLLVSGTSTSFPALPSTPDGIGGIRKGMVQMFLWNPSTGSHEQTLRLQSVTVDGSLTRTPAEQLGDQKSYFRQLERPIEVSITVEALASDLEEYAKISGNESGFDAGTLLEIDLDDFSNTNQLDVIVYNSETNKTFATELKRIVVKNLSLSTEADNISVGEDGTTTLTFTADNFLISGSGVSPFV